MTIPVCEIRKSPRRHWIPNNDRIYISFFFIHNFIMVVCFIGLVQDCSNSTADALELLRSCTKSLILSKNKQSTFQCVNSRWQIYLFDIWMYSISQQAWAQFVLWCVFSWLRVGRLYHYLWALLHWHWGIMSTNAIDAITWFIWVHVKQH